MKIAPSPHHLEFYNHLPCACITVDQAGKIVNANDAFLKYTGFDRDDILNTIVIENILPSDQDPIDHTGDFKNRHREATDISYGRLIKKNQQSIHCSITVTALSSENFEYFYYSFIDCSKMFGQIRNDDNTESNFTERKLNKLILELQKINSTITHEIQNPIQNMMGLIILLKQSYVESFNSAELIFLDHLKDSGEKVRHHLNALLKNSTNGKGITEKKYVDLNKILGDVKIKQNDLIFEKNVNIQIPTSLPRVFGIADDLSKLFDNLIKNAIQFRASNNPLNIIISFVQKETFYHFTIEDNGKGIDKSHHKKIFEDYYKLKPDGEDCTGLGLPESRKIVENHNGTIGVVSNKNKGCTIYFSLEG